MDTLQEVIEVIPFHGIAEPVSSFTHLLGALVCLVAAPTLAARARRHGCTTPTIHLFSFACVMLLALSGTYHMFDAGTTARAVMKRLDVAAIFFLIASTCTPLYVLLFKGIARWAQVASVWTVAVVGITLRMIFFDSISPWFGLGMFLSMGWMGAGASIVIWRRYGLNYIARLIYGGIAYTLGAIGLGLNWPTLVPGYIGPHEVWHLAVLIGIAFHWAFVWHVAGGPPTLHHDWSETRQIGWEEELSEGEQGEPTE